VYPVHRHHTAQRKKVSTIIPNPGKSHIIKVLVHPHSQKALKWHRFLKNKVVQLPGPRINVRIQRSSDLVPDDHPSIMAVQTERVDQIAQVVLEDGMMNLTPDALQIFRAAWRGHAHLYAKILKRGQMHLDAFEVSNDEASDFFGLATHTNQGVLTMGFHPDAILHQRREGSAQKARHIPRRILVSFSIAF
jgi:hypothetical protein